MNHWILGLPYCQTSWRFFLQQAGHWVIPHVPCQQFKSLNIVQ